MKQQNLLSCYSLQTLVTTNRFTQSGLSELGLLDEMQIHTDYKPNSGGKPGCSSYEEKKSPKASLHRDYFPVILIVNSIGQTASRHTTT